MRLFPMLGLADTNGRTIICASLVWSGRMQILFSLHVNKHVCDKVDY